MAQQINLYSPILLAPRKQFSARAMATALAVLALGLCALGAGMGWQHHRVDLEHQRIATQQANERAQLTIALANQQAAQLSGPALEQELHRVEAATQEREGQLLASRQGRLSAGQRHSDLLDLLARTVPASAWVTRLHASQDAVSLGGATTDPLAVRLWTEDLGRTPVLQGLLLASVTVERNAREGEAGAPSAPPTWAFRIVSARSRAAAGQLGGTGAQP